MRAALVPAFAGAALLGAACTRSEVRYWPDGTRRLEGRVSTWTGREEGAWRWFHPNGEVREEGRYDDGARTGTWQEWWSNGQRRARGERGSGTDGRTGVRTGAWTFWHSNGVVSARGAYADGEREGWWECSLDNGALDGDASGLWHRGQPVRAP